MDSQLIRSEFDNVSELIPSKKSVFSDSRQARVYTELLLMLREADDNCLRVFLDDLLFNKNSSFGDYDRATRLECLQNLIRLFFVRISDEESEYRGLLKSPNCP